MKYFIIRFTRSSLFISLLFICQESIASHSAGVDLTYSWISSSGDSSVYRVTGTFYRDCSGIPAPVTLDIIVRSDSCNRTINASLAQVPGTGNEIPYYCFSTVTNCTNSSSPYIGYQEYIYRGVVTLPVRCSNWVFSYQICCRNCAITTIVQSVPCTSGGVASNIYVEATLNNLAVPYNNSPDFSNRPLAYICVGENFTFNQGGYEYDQDSLYYELVDARSTDSTSVPYLFPFSGTNPLTSVPSVTINHSTGDIFLNAQNIQVGVMAIRIKEFRNGILVGSVTRDMQFNVINCQPNHLPFISGINGTGQSDITVCGGKTISFMLNSDDQDVSNTVVMFWDGGIPGATFNVIGSPHPTGVFTWNTTLADVRQQPYQFSVMVRDDHCPSNGYQIYAFNVKVAPPVVPDAGPDVTICSGTVTTLNASGGDHYLWSNNDTTASANVSPSGTTSYSVIVTNNEGCSESDSVSVTVIPSPSAIYIIYPDIVIPHNWITENHSTGIPPFSYVWSWGDGSPDSTGVTPSHTYSNPGFYNICLMAVDSLGCSDTLCDSSTYLNRTASGATMVTINATSSPTGVVGFPNPGNYIGIYPNPANDNFTLSIQSIANAQVKISITNVMGELVYKTQDEHVNGNYSKEISLENVASGVYFISVSVNENNSSFKLMKE